jgi:uncharacterized membrane protein YwaF
MLVNVLYNWKSIFANLPIALCDLNMFILSIALLKKGKKELLNKYILYVTVLVPLFVVIRPEIRPDLYTWYSPIVMGKLLPHILYSVVAILYLLFNVKHISTKKSYEVIINLILITTTLHIINMALVYSGLCPGANYFYTISEGNLTWVTNIARHLGSNNKFIRNYLVMILTVTCWVIVLNIIHRTIEYIYYNKIKKNHTKQIN